MLLQNVDQLTDSLLQKLCDDKCPESQTLDFKRELPGNTDKEKHEICKDVAALANTDGGDLVYGIEEENGAAGSICPIAGEPSDAAMRRIAQVIDAGVEPRIHGIKMRAIDVDGGYAIVVRVPTSFDGPHCIRVNNSRRFVMRNGTTITDMSFDQLRSAFDRSATLAERARAFIADRLRSISEQTTTAPLQLGPHFVVHLVPIAGLAGRKTVDLRNVDAGAFSELYGNDWGGCSRTFNFDGLLIHRGGRQNDGYYAYNHVFRTGAIEGARVGGATQEVSSGVEKPIVWSLDMSKFFHNSVKQFLSSSKDWGFAGPAVLSVAVLNVKGYQLATGDVFRKFSHAMADRPHLIPPDLWIEEIDSVNLDGVVRPLLDNLWQAFDIERCPHFDEKTGAFSPPTY